MRIEAGQPLPLGATLVAGGVNIAVFSAHATRIELCLFDATGANEIARLTLPAHTDGIWHGLLPGAGAGLVYGLRAHGPADPTHGHRFNPAKLLLDPYARRLGGTFRWTDAHLGDVHGADPHAALDNAPDQWKAVVGDGAFDWGDDRPPQIPLAESELYELHVKGFTQRHPGVPEALRGRFAGLASAAAITHLRALGVTAVNLLPVHQHLDEMRLARSGRTNFWGYNTLAFFVPDQRFAQDDPIREFKAMVRDLHAAGIEVILDVVFNHTAEGDQRGPTLSWRGLDNSAWYRLRHEDARFYENHSGTGNSLKTSHRRVLQFVMDCLRYWVTDMHVDGFRFDLASSLARGAEGFDSKHPFLKAIMQDPVLNRVKLIAEPWDSGPGGYQLGHFPAGWSEWNDRYRDAARAFWVRKTADRGQFATRLAGSSDLFAHGGRTPAASINYVTAHDGFTLTDLVSYERKRNAANGEDNRDGSDANLSWNCGVEGETSLLGVRTLRNRLKRALLATLMISRGVPMLAAGDEMGRTQGGNNNAYLSDDETGWLDWARADAELMRFTARLIALRRATPQLRSSAWLTGAPDAGGRRDIVWLNREGTEMLPRDWHESGRFVFGARLNGPATDLLALFNAETNDCVFPLPAGAWRMCFDTTAADPFATSGAPVESVDQAPILIRARGVLVLDRAVESSA